MMRSLDNIVVNKELTPELIKRKEELAWGLDLELDRIALNQSLVWPAKQKQSAEIRQKYETIWEQELTDAGYIVRPMFEDWYAELSEINN